MMERIRFGILGTGHIAKQFAHGLRFVKDAELVAIGSRKAETAQSFANEWAATGASTGAGAAVPRAHGSYAALVADPAIDVVYIATPQSRHADDSCLCLDAGKAVLCEKPFATTAEEARRVIDRARERGLFCMEAMWMRFIPLMREVVAMVQGGSIGEVQTLEAEFGIPVGSSAGDHRLRPELGGGALLGRGVYAVSLGSQLFGRPVHMHATVAEGPTGVDEQISATLVYRGGQTVHFSASLKSYMFNEASLSGTEGRIRIHEPFIRPHRLSLRKFRAEASGGGGTSKSASQNLKQKLRASPTVQTVLQHVERFLPKGTTTRVRPVEGNGMNYEAAEVVRCLRAGLRESEIMPLHETLAVMETMDALRRQWLRVQDF